MVAALYDGVLKTYVRAGELLADVVFLAKFGELAEEFTSAVGVAHCWIPMCCAVSSECFRGLGFVCKSAYVCMSSGAVGDDDSESFSSNRRHVLGGTNKIDAD